METILVVDDDNINLSICKALLSERYHTVTAESGVQALGYIKAGNIPDLILLDIYMPALSGFEVLRQIREASQTKSIPVILISGASDTDTMMKGYQAGASDYLFKPIEPELVRLKVNSWLTYSRLEKENIRLRKKLDVIQQVLISP